ncbi:MAG TPA: AraC family transcriptional regulator ligand-binding domain-containing protein, partial [Polyangiaceae bacterium]|nr:AraC family transcriptional regulator ligand-binding domain-containing protein [Polyangiaceae bacterium]
TLLWDEAARLTGDSAFGMHAAEQLRPGAFDVVDYAVRTAPTLRASLERLARYNRLVHDAAVFVLVQDGKALRVEHCLHGAKQSPQAAEFTLASVMVVGAQINGAAIWPSRVTFQHQAQGPEDEYARLFGIAPSFSTPVNSLTFSLETLERALPATDPLLSRVIERHAEALLAARPALAETTAARVRRTLCEILGKEEAVVTLSRLASRLRMSERSLQRRLSDEGHSFDRLLDDLRHELAVRYLADKKIAIAEVAFLLGYSEPSAFHRAFKRWTGSTPSQVRQGAA